MEELSIIDFVEGERDCKEGNPQKDNASESYSKGYKFQSRMSEFLKLDKKGRK